MTRGVVLRALTESEATPMFDADGMRRCSFNLPITCSACCLLFYFLSLNCRTRLYAPCLPSEYRGAGEIAAVYHRSKGSVQPSVRPSTRCAETQSVTDENSYSPVPFPANDRSDTCLRPRLVLTWPCMRLLLAADSCFPSAHFFCTFSCSFFLVLFLWTFLCIFFSCLFVELTCLRADAY